MSISSTNIKVKLVWLILSILLILILYFIIIFNNGEKQEVQSEQQTILPFSNKNIVLIKKDSFVLALKNGYKTNMSYSENQNKLKLMIWGQGQSLSDFINSNTNLTKIKNFGFDIDYKPTNDTLKANFEIEKNDSLLYVKIPIDVAIGLTGKLNSNDKP